MDRALPIRLAIVMSLLTVTNTWLIQAASGAEYMTMSPSDSLQEVTTQSSSPFADSPENAAQKGIGIGDGPARMFLLSPMQEERFKKDVEDFSMELGFISAQEELDSTLGKPLMLKQVGLRQLSRFKAGVDPKDLVSDGKQIIYPVTAGMSYRSSVWVAQRKDKEKNNELRWRWIRRGKAPIIEDYEKLRKNLKEEKNLDANTVLEIPGFMQFLGADTENGMVLIFPYDAKIGNLTLKAGEPKAASDVFQGLAPEASEILNDGEKTGVGILR